MRSAVLILAVHSTTPVLGIACAEDDRVLGEVVLPPGRRHLEYLAVTIRDLVVKLRINLAEMDGFGVAIGPGSFSGIRVGLATIKGMALALSKPVVGVSCLDILAWQGLREGETGAAVIDAKRGELYCAVYARNENRLQLLDAPQLIGSDELLDLMRRGGASVLISGDQDQVHTYGHAGVLRMESPSAVACAQLALESLRRGEADELHALKPLYIRRSDAEEKRRIHE
jgi:tRNA threonylcarbamoyladenosine biosynthesis protein TsaB